MFTNNREVNMMRPKLILSMIDRAQPQVQLLNKPRYVNIQIEKRRYGH